MLKNKKILISLLLVLVVFLIPGVVNAAVEYTRSFPGNDGTVEINLTGLQLDESKQYEFSLVSKGGTPNSWNLITDYTTTTAKIILNPSTEEICNILKITDDGQIFIREKDNTDNYVVDRLNVNLKLPYLKAVKYELSYDWYSIQTMYSSIGGGLTSKNTYYKFEKVTDENFIRTFLNNSKQTDKLEEILPNAPDTGYTQDGHFNSANYNDGLYILWIRMTGENCKTINAAIIHDGLPNATTLEEYLPTINDENNDNNQEQINVIRYISFPFIINNGKSSVSLRNGVYDGEYTMYYQFVEVSNEVYNKLETVKEQYENDQITYEEFLAQYNNIVTQYDNTKWIKTEDGSFEIDLNKFTGTKKFALWVKLEMEDKTVYEAEVYTMNGSGSATTEEPDSTNKPGAEDTNKGDTNTKDPTIADKELPNTGKVILAWIIGVVAVFGIVAHIRYKKLYM